MSHRRTLAHTSSNTNDHSRTWSGSSLSWWPTLAGIILGFFIAIDMSAGSELASVVAASGLVYVGSAALQKPSSAWPLFLGTFAIITAAKFGIATIDPTWIFLGFGAFFIVYGRLHDVTRPASVLPVQAIAMVGFGIAAAVALVIEGRAGAYLVAIGLFGHAAWDVRHHRANTVVVRSMAEFCCVLDTLLAVAILVVART
jgi:hypothetical protein